MTPSLTVCQNELVDATKRMALCLLAVLACLLIGNALGGCALFHGSTPTTPEEVLEHNYTTEIVACAAMAGYPGAYDRDADMRCRAEVDCMYQLGPCP